MLTAITAAPRWISPEDHLQLTSSTPESFSSIPPVLRHKQDSVRVRFEPDWEGYGSAGVEGTLFVTEEALSFLPSSPNTDTKGFTLSYPSITLHAISRDDPALGPCVYCQLDESADEPEGSQSAPPQAQTETENDGHYRPENDEEQDTPMREMRLFVDEASLEAIFLSLSACASLHPSIFDAVDGMSDDEGIYDDPLAAPGAGFVPFTGEDDEELSAAGRAALEHLESIIVWPTPKPEEGQDAAAVEKASKSNEGQPQTNGK